MEQYIKNSEIVAEIKRRIEAHKETLKNCDSSISEMVLKGSMSAYQSLLHLLDTLEVEGEDFKPMDSDFERDAVSFCFDNGLNTTPYIAKTIAKHFYELGLKAQKGE